MADTDSVKRQTLALCAEVSAEINRAETPQALACALAREEVAQLVPFDFCSLVLPGPGGEGLRVWRGRRAELRGDERAAEVSDTAATPLGLVVSAGAPVVINEGVGQGAASQFGDSVKSVLALPLSMRGRSFGALCFASLRPDAYAKDDAQKLAWLADHVAAAAQGLLLRAQFESTRETAREIERLKSGFINTLVRDVRLPLTSVLGLLELFESKLQARESFDLEDRQLLGAAIENGDRIRHLLDNHLEIAQQKERPLKLELGTVEVERMLEDVAEPLRGEAALRGVELNIQVSTRTLKLHVDRQQTERALCHLLTTALAATPDGGCVNIEAQSIMGTRAGDEGRRLVVINVADSSQGIPPEEVPFIFDAFWQAANSRNPARGLGLAIAKRIAAAHGGNVSVRSQMGKGTVYSLVLPTGQPVSLQDAHRILIVDDAPELLLLLRKLVARMGYQVEVASHARAALEILCEKRIDLLITDWAMPEMNGGELILALKRDERLSHIPTIVLTGHDTDTERSDARAAGCDRFIVKPIKRDEFQRVIEELLKDVQSPKPVFMTSDFGLWT